jgi:hypothetical protein
MTTPIATNPVIRIACGVALVIAVTAAPVRAPRSAGGCFRPNYFCRYFAPVAANPIRLAATSVTTCPAAPVKALPAETEENLSGTTCPAAYSSDLPPIPSRKPPHDLTTSEPVRASRPLRC